MTENVYLFVPNIVDYVRVVLAFVSFYYILDDYVMTTCLYLLGTLLDEVDGILARKFNQESKFGALLDMLIDRMVTMCLCAALCHFYPRYMLLLQLYMAVDIIGHWFYLHSTMMRGRESHKDTDSPSNPILRFYYNGKVVLTTLCITNELFFCMLYLLNFTEGPTVLFGVGLWRVILYLSAPLSFIKTGITLVHLAVAVDSIVQIDIEDRQRMKDKFN